jgi:hypothetical protein
MNITRRYFLNGVIAVTAGQLIKPSFARPRIYGNAMDDDTAGLNAFFAGEPFLVDDTSLILGEGHLIGGKFKISDRLILYDRARINGSCFTLIGKLVGRDAPFPIAYSSPDDHTLVENCVFFGTNDWSQNETLAGIRIPEPFVPWKD